jgi:hypothetical protein
LLLQDNSFPFNHAQLIGLLSIQSPHDTSKSKGFVSSMGTAYDVIYSSILFRKKFRHVFASAISKLNQTKAKGSVSFNMINVIIIWLLN